MDLTWQNKEPRINTESDPRMRQNAGGCYGSHLAKGTKCQHQMDRDPLFGDQRCISHLCKSYFKSDLRGGRWDWYRFQDDDVDDHLEDDGGEDEDDSFGDEELIQMPPTRSTAHHQGVSQPEHYAMHHSPWCVLNHSSTRSVPLWCSLYQESSNTGVHCTERLVLVNLVHCCKSLGTAALVHCSRSVVFVHQVQCHWPHPRPPNQQAPRGLPSTQPLPAMKPTSQNILNVQL